MADWLSELGAIFQPEGVSPADNPKALIGYCEKCNVWTKFIRDYTPEWCKNCGAIFSNRVGYQITTQRSFDPKTKRAKIKKW